MSKKNILLGPSKKFKNVDATLDEWVGSPAVSIQELPNVKEEGGEVRSTTRTSINIPSSLHGIIRKRSFEDGVTMNENILRVLLREFSPT
jgi:hypothetical protein